MRSFYGVNPLNAELNPTSHLLALLGAHHILHVSGVRVKPGGTYTDRWDGKMSVLQQDDLEIPLCFKVF